MMKGFVRKLEWLLIVGLLVGAVIAVGCSNAKPEPINPGANLTAERTAVGVGETVYLHGFYIGMSGLYIPTESMTVTAWPTSLEANKPALVRYNLESTGYYYMIPTIEGYYTVTYEYKAGSQLISSKSIIISVGNVPPATNPASTDPAVNSGAYLTADKTVIGVGETVYFHGYYTGLSGNYTPTESMTVTAWPTSLEENKPAIDRYTPNGSPIVNPQGYYKMTPTIAGNYTVTYSYSAGAQLISSMSVTISVNAPIGTPNIAPVANAGPAQTATNGSSVSLSGALSTDANNDPLTYAWTLSSSPAGSNANTTLTGATTVTPSFTPDLAGEYILRLVVNDGTVDSAASTTTVTSAAAPTPPPDGPILTVTDLQTVLANNAFLNRHATAASGLYELFEFGPVGGSMTFTFINPYGANLRRTGTWSVAGAVFPQATENAGPRALNSAAPVHETSLLTMTGYISYAGGLTGGDVETWLKVAPVTVSNFSGKNIEFNGGPPTPVYSFAANTVNRTGVYYASSIDTSGSSFTWNIVNGNKAVLTFVDGSSRHLYLTVRGAMGSVVREMGIVYINSSGTVTGGSLDSWIWM